MDLLLPLFTRLIDVGRPKAGFSERNPFLSSPGLFITGTRSGVRFAAPKCWIAFKGLLGRVAV